LFDKYIGIPYKHKGRDFDGCDCFGLCWLILINELNVDIPDFTDLKYTKEFYRRKEDIFKDNIYNFANQIDPPYKKLDGILFYSELSNNIVNHMGIMVDNHRFIHLEEDTCSKIDKLTPYWESRLYTGVRYFGKNNL